MKALVSQLAVVFLIAMLVLATYHFLGRVRPASVATPSHQAARISVVIQWPEDKLGTFGVWSVMSRLEKEARGLYEVDGYDRGSGTINFFLFSTNPDSAVARVLEAHNRDPLPGDFRIAVAVDYNDTRTDWTYKPVHPPGLSRFDLMDRTNSPPPG